MYLLVWELQKGPSTRYDMYVISVILAYIILSTQQSTQLLIVYDLIVIVEKCLHACTLNHIHQDDYHI